MSLSRSIASCFESEFGFELDLFCLLCGAVIEESEAACPVVRTENVAYIIHVPENFNSAVPRSPAESRPSRLAAC